MESNPQFKSRFGIPLKLAAIFTAAIFSFDTVMWAEPSIGTARVRYETPERGIAASPLYGLEIPDAIGSVQERYLPEASGSGLGKTPFVIHIQDAHAHPEAQKNIQSILEYLAKEKHISRIALEGGFGKIDPKILELLPVHQVNYEMAEYLASLGELTGAELYAVKQNGSAVRVDGVDDIALYKRSYEIFRQLKLREGEFTKVFEVYEKILARLEPKIFGGKLRDYVQKKRLWNERSDEILGYFQTLSELSKEFLSLDLADPRNQFDWPNLTRIVKSREIDPKLSLEKARSERDELLGELNTKLKDRKTRDFLTDGLRYLLEKNDADPFHSWLAGNKPFPNVKSLRHFFEVLRGETKDKKIQLLNYPNLLAYGGLLILREEIDASALFKEVGNLEEKLEAKLTQNDEERKLLVFEKDFLLVKRLLALEITRDDDETYQIRKLELSANQLQSRLKSFIPKDIRIPALSNELLQLGNEFYILSRKRDEALLENTLKLANRSDDPRKAIVLITGGFHSEGLTNLLKKRGIPHLVVSPKMTHFENKGLYERVMLGKNFDLKHLFGRGDALIAAILAQDPALLKSVGMHERQMDGILKALLTKGASGLLADGYSGEQMVKAVAKAVAENPKLFEDLSIQPVYGEANSGSHLLDVRIPSRDYHKTFRVTNEGLRGVDANAPSEVGLERLGRKEIASRSRRSEARAKLTEGGIIIFRDNPSVRWKIIRINSGRVILKPQNQKGIDAVDTSMERLLERLRGSTYIDPAQLKLEQEDDDRGTVHEAKAQIEQLINEDDHVLLPARLQLLYQIMSAVLFSYLLLEELRNRGDLVEKPEGPKDAKLPVSSFYDDYFSDPSKLQKFADAFGLKEFSPAEDQNKPFIHSEKWHEEIAPLAKLIYRQDDLVRTLLGQMQFDANTGKVTNSNPGSMVNSIIRVAWNYLEFLEGTPKPNGFFRYFDRPLSSELAIELAALIRSHSRAEVRHAQRGTARREPPSASRSELRAPSDILAGILGKLLAERWASSEKYKNRDLAFILQDIRGRSFGIMARMAIKRRIQDFIRILKSDFERALQADLNITAAAREEAIRKFDDEIRKYIPTDVSDVQAVDDVIIIRGKNAHRELRILTLALKIAEEPSDPTDPRTAQSFLRSAKRAEEPSVEAALKRREKASRAAAEIIPARFEITGQGGVTYQIRIDMFEVGSHQEIIPSQAGPAPRPSPHFKSLREPAVSRPLLKILAVVGIMAFLSWVSPLGLAASVLASLFLLIYFGARKIKRFVAYERVRFSAIPPHARWVFGQLTIEEILILQRIYERARNEFGQQEMEKELAEMLWSRERNGNLGQLQSYFIEKGYVGASLTNQQFVDVI
ncbi:MAG: hypothetical protein HY585_05770, partial [Candidatus Omnitrophica bacterium]|nr:hypothetical protein [Candidatus Omnitrophota bacterium]